jgi:hypothetical protein
MTPPIAITLTIKMPAPVDGGTDAIDRLAEEVREIVESAVHGAYEVELDDWTSGGGQTW